MEFIETIVDFFVLLYNYNPFIFVVTSFLLIVSPYILKKGDA